jgi:glyoxylase-like metal-dependent hydrolase (beta-lactamase superfamily II)
MRKAMLMGLISAVCASAALAGESDGIFSYRVGRLEVFLLVESERDGSAGILVGADEEVLQRYIPASGFRHTANAVLIKAPRQNILIDTGTGSGGIIIEKIRSLGVAPENVDAVIISHLHGDHFGSLQRDGAAVFPRAKVYVSARDHEYFTRTNVNQGAVAALAPYGSRLTIFDPPALGQRLRPLITGISPIAAYGHTPGHTIFLIEDRRERLLIVADLLHVALVQFPVPEISATFDVDPAQAAVTRRQVLNWAAANRVPIAGMHIVYPGLGNVTVEGEGFKFTPAN